MTLVPGTRLGAYEIAGPLGAGGMGEVYRARDTKLDRDVALKILPEAFVHDPDRAARFQREAKTLAALNHPHIGGIYGLEEAPGVTALVLELVEGPTLADRIARGPIPLDEALPIARQIAEALEAAHEHGIIHRDLKPANIKVRDDGTVKVLDFGLAKALGPAAGGGAVESPALLTQSPTLLLAATQAGVILGTAAYMSPEQARGKPVDKRADIWAFGCVLYEMLTGKRAFQGDDISDVYVAIMRDEPDWHALPPDTPAPIRRLLRRALAKDPKLRFREAGSAIVEIEEGRTSSDLETRRASPIPRLHLWQRPAAAAAIALLIAVAAGAAVWMAIRPAPPRVTRTAIPASGATAITINGNDRDVTITPDGTRIVYVGGTQIFVRALDQLEPTPIGGVGQPRHVFVSPDGQWIGYFDGNTALKRVTVTGGAPVTISRLDGNATRGATWGQDDTIVFATGATGTGLLRVPAAGGEATVLTRPDRGHGEGDHVWPEFLPGGQQVLFTILAGAPENAQVAVFDLRTGTHKVLLRGGSHAHYVPSGHLVYGAAGTLRAVALDLDRLEVVGAPTPVLQDVVTTAVGAADFNVAADGTLVYVSGSTASAARTLVWVDRQEQEAAIAAPSRVYQDPRISPDGTRVAFDIRDQESDIWIWSLARATLTRFTFDPAPDRYPTWTPDGRRLVFSSDRAGATSLFWQAADGTGTVERLTTGTNDQFSTTVSPDGAGVVFHETTPTASGDLMLVRVEGTPRNAQALVRTPFAENNAEISPDGRWLAYQSDESGLDEIYVRPFPNVDAGRWQVSAGGGRQPLWARSGRELFYRSLTGTVMRVGIEPGAAWATGTPAVLLGRPYYYGAGSATGRTYDVSPDGQRFLMIKQGDGSDQAAAPPSIVVVQNWLEELKRLVPRN